MQYMFLIYEDEAAYADADEATLSDVVAKHLALTEEMRQAGVLLGGDGLQPTPTATTVVTGSGGAKTLHDGPFAETREHLGGYYLVEAPDLDAALVWAKRIPVVDGGKVEVRPVMTY